VQNDESQEISQLNTQTIYTTSKSTHEWRCIAVCVWGT